jgi:DNA-binding LytR/AlgR family response regulator
MVLRALIIDDEFAARHELRYLLDKFDSVEVVGEAASSSEALKLIQAVEYDVLFLDINMPGMNGLKLAEKIKDLPRKPSIVFITANDNYALDAFDLDAADYLMKPIEKRRLKRAIEKAASSVGSQGIAAVQEKAGQVQPAAADYAHMQKELAANRIGVFQGDKMVLVDVNDICFAYAECEKVYIKTFDKSYFTRLTLKELEAKLPEDNFYRVHRGFIVNIHKIREMHPHFNYTYLLVVNDKERSEVPVSRVQGRKFRKILGY